MWSCRRRLLGLRLPMVQSRDVLSFHAASLSSGEDERSNSEGQFLVHVGSAVFPSMSNARRASHCMGCPPGPGMECVGCLTAGWRGLGLHPAGLHPLGARGGTPARRCHLGFTADGQIHRWPKAVAGLSSLRKSRTSCSWWQAWSSCSPVLQERGGLGQPHLHSDLPFRRLLASFCIHGDLRHTRDQISQLAILRHDIRAGAEEAVVEVERAFVGVRERLVICLIKELGSFKSLRASSRALRPCDERASSGH